MDDDIERQVDTFATWDQITCPQCGMTSYEPDDIREGYCGNCEAWTTKR